MGKVKKILKVCGGYTSVKVLGEGSYGEVRKVTRNGVTLAAKISKLTEIGGREFFSSDIIKEIDLLTRLRHPNVISAVDGPYLSPDRVCVFMDLLPIDLYDAMEKELSPALKLGWANKLWSGLAYLHANFVVHCDIKTANIMVNPITSEIKIIDYGLTVNLPASRRVKLTSRIVSNWWRPPEIFGMMLAQASGNRPLEYYFGTEVDVYSMGWVILELMAGIEPPRLHSDNPENYYWYLIAMGMDPGPGFVTTNPPIKLSQKTNRVTINVKKINKTYLSKVISAKAPKCFEKYLTLVAKAVTSAPLKRPRAVDFLVNPTPIVISYPRVDISYGKYYDKVTRSEAIKLLERILYYYRLTIGDTNVDSVLLEAIDLMDRIFSVRQFSDKDFLVGVATAASMTLCLYTWEGEAYSVVIMGILTEEQREIFFQTYSEIILALNGRLFRPTLDFGGDITTKDALKIFKEELSPSDIKSYLNAV